MLIIFDRDGVLIDSDDPLGARGRENSPRSATRSRRGAGAPGSPVSPPNVSLSWSAKSSAVRFRKVITRAKREPTESSRTRCCRSPACRRRRCARRPALHLLRTPVRTAGDSRSIKAGLWDRFRPYVFSAQAIGEGARQTGARRLPARRRRSSRQSRPTRSSLRIGCRRHRRLAAGMRVIGFRRRVAHLAGPWRGADGGRPDDGDHAASRKFRQRSKRCANGDRRG